MNNLQQPREEEAKVYYNRGLIYYEQKEWELALADYNKAIQLNPDLAQAYYNLGVLYYQIHEKQKAIKNLQQAARLFMTQGNIATYESVINLLNRL
ncbi:MAG: tetratricopeptide repeat protein [Nostoc sp.]|uniref:tetratricopeptide repeat protein n=1 Tax=Nostoc sp. TaxID=1180 RepID=UPI002FF8CEAE